MQSWDAEIILIYWGCHQAWFNTHFLLMLLEWTFIYFYILSKSNLRAVFGSLILKWLMNEWHAQLILLPSVLKINNQFDFIPVKVGHCWVSSTFSGKNKSTWRGSSLGKCLSLFHLFWVLNVGSLWPLKITEIITIFVLLTNLPFLFPTSCISSISTLVELFMSEN